MLPSQPPRHTNMSPLCFATAASVHTSLIHHSLCLSTRRPHSNKNPLSHRSHLHASPTACATPLQNVSVILLAGGSGTRMKADCPKQFIPLAGMPVIEYSLDLFASMLEVSQIVLVADLQHRERFARHIDLLGSKLTFAMPGKERQNSVFNGLMMVREGASLACIHDSARPLVTVESVRHVLEDARKHGAAVLGVPSKATIKESEDGQFVLRTIPRNRLWEIQTPQVVEPELLNQGFEKVKKEGLEVTDDVSIIEQLGKPVKITLGEYTNIKLTTPEDLNVAELILKERARDIAKDVAEEIIKDTASV